MRLTGRGSLDLALYDFLLLLIIGRRFTSFSGVPMGARSHGGHRMRRAPRRGHAWACLFSCPWVRRAVSAVPNRLARVRPRSTTRTRQVQASSRLDRGLGRDRGSGKALATRPRRRQAAPLIHTREQIASWRAWFRDPVNSVVFLNDYLVSRQYQDLEFRQHFMLVQGSREEYFSNRLRTTPRAASSSAADETQMPF